MFNLRLTIQSGGIARLVMILLHLLTFHSSVLAQSAAEQEESIWDAGEVNVNNEVGVSLQVKPKRRGGVVLDLLRIEEKPQNNCRDGNQTGLMGVSVTENYMTKIYLGSPPQKVSLLLDVNDDFIWTNCKARGADDSRNNSHPLSLPAYDPFKSSTQQPLPCSDGLCRQLSNTSCLVSTCRYSYHGYEDQLGTPVRLDSDILTLKSATGTVTHKMHVVFGCGEYNEVGARSFGKVDGVIGVGQGPLSLPAQLSHRFGDKFSYCLTSYKIPGSHAGSLFIGDVGAMPASPNGTTKSSLQYTPILKHNSSSYFVELKAISVDGQLLNISSRAFTMEEELGYGGTIVDPATYITTLVPEAFDALRAHLELIIPFPKVDESLIPSFPLCFNLSSQSPSNPYEFPTITFHLKPTTDFIIPQSNAFVPAKQKQLELGCLAMAPSPAQKSVNVLGGLLQQNFHVTFDRENSRLGFYNLDCLAFITRYSSPP